MNQLSLVERAASQPAIPGAVWRKGGWYFRALCLWQPFASLVGDGLKTIETRLHPTTIRGPFVVCSTQKVAPAALYWETRGRFEGAHPSKTWSFVGAGAPRGVTLAVVRLKECRPMTVEDEPGALIGWQGPKGTARHAWVLEVGRVPLEPVEVTGRQGWFWLPATLVRRAARSTEAG